MRWNRDWLKSPLAGAAAGALAVAIVTGAVAVFKHFVPVLSLGVLYVFAVLPVAVLWWSWVRRADPVANFSGVARTSGPWTADVFSAGAGLGGQLSGMMLAAGRGPRSRRGREEEL